MFCIGAGLLMATGTFYVIKIYFADQNERIIIAAIGLTSSLLTEFVATVVLTMYARSVKSFVRFHARISKSQQLLLGNIFLQQIEGPKLRGRALAMVSIELAKGTNARIHSTGREKRIRSTNRVTTARY